MSTLLDAERLAWAVARAMFERDAASRALGMRIVAMGPGRAQLEMTVRADMVNGHQICHGGMIFTLADSAFAFACNSRDRVAVAAGCSIEFVAPAKLGDRLAASATEQTRAGRSGVYDVHVTDGTGQTVALLRGRSRERDESVLSGPASSSEEP